MKKVYILSILLGCLSFSNAQQLNATDLSASVGNWIGSLTYLDYSTGKPYSMMANIKIGLTENKKGYIIEYEYPKEPHANSTDTVFIDGKLFGKENIVDFKKQTNNDFILITEIKGEDGNDHKKALLRHIYQLTSDRFSIEKQIKFEGTNTWIKRNEYLFTRNLQVKYSTLMYRIAKIKVDANHLDAYKAALQEQMNAAIKLEPGVLSYTAVADKKDATSITILEVYANIEAYQAHIQMPHFKKYKETVKDWVLSLELIDTDLVVSTKKEGF